MKKITSILFGIILLLMPLNQVKVMASEIGLQDLPPKLIIESYHVEGEQLIPGEDFTLKLKIKNTNPYVDAHNVMISYSSSNLVVYPVYGESNQSFIEKVSAGKSEVVELHMTVLENANTNVASISIQMDYSSDNSSNSISSSGIILPISASCNMEIRSLSVAQSSMLGSKSLVSIAYTNTGSADIRNAKMILEGDILEEQKEVLLGDLLIGAQASKDCYVNFQHEGEQNLSISFSYEDSNGVVYTIPEQKFTTMVNPIVVDSSGVTAPNEEPNQTLFEELELWQVVLMIGGIVAILIIIIAIIHSKNRRKF